MSFPHWTNDYPFHHHRLYSTIFHHSSLYPNFSSIFRYLQSFMTSMSMVLANKPWWFQPWFFPIDGRKKKTNHQPEFHMVCINLPPFFHKKKKVNTLHIPTWFIHVHTTSTIFPHFSTTKNMANPKSPMGLRRGLARRLRSPAPGYLWGSGSPPGPRSPWPPGCWIPGWRWMDLQKNTT